MTGEVSPDKIIHVIQNQFNSLRIPPEEVANLMTELVFPYALLPDCLEAVAPALKALQSPTNTDEIFVVIQQAKDLSMIT